MAYQVLARKWRPQQFDDVIGQPAVTRTLKNALTSRRIAQSFVFAGPRGVGKTTTARILARALSCAKGPTADPCGACDACLEIAEGRDIDVLEIDAAPTSVTTSASDHQRPLDHAGGTLQGLHHRRGPPALAQSFNALLKSIEEPPPHVVFMMATRLSKIPDGPLAIAGVRVPDDPVGRIADQLRNIARAEDRDRRRGAAARGPGGRGSMRDAQSARSGDRVRRRRISADDVATVLRLVGRDLVLDVVTLSGKTPAAASRLSDARSNRYVCGSSSRAGAGGAGSAGAVGRSSRFADPGSPPRPSAIG